MKAKMPTTTNKKKEEHPFLHLPTEIRQQILSLSLSDIEILESVELRAVHSRDNIWQTNVWGVEWYCGGLSTTLPNAANETSISRFPNQGRLIDPNRPGQTEGGGREGGQRLKNGQSLGKPAWLVLLEECELFEKDRIWVRDQWEARVRELGDRKKRAWEGVFGKR
jgi:hypothetical protein